MLRRVPVHFDPAQTGRTLRDKIKTRISRTSVVCGQKLSDTMLELRAVVVATFARAVQKNHQRHFFCRRIRRSRGQQTIWQRLVAFGITLGHGQKTIGKRGRSGRR